MSTCATVCNDRIRLHNVLDLRDIECVRLGEHWVTLGWETCRSIRACRPSQLEQEHHHSSFACFAMLAACCRVLCAPSVQHQKSGYAHDYEKTSWGFLNSCTGRLPSWNIEDKTSHNHHLCLLLCWYYVDWSQHNRLIYTHIRAESFQPEGSYTSPLWSENSGCTLTLDKLKYIFSNKMNWIIICYCSSYNFKLRLY